MTDSPWKIEVVVLVPREDAENLDDAVEAVGEKLRPLPWDALVRARPS